jgi:tetratricopeptide (TPR) repeat protein
MFSKKKQVFICEDCEHEFSVEKEFVSKRVFISYGRDEHAALAEKIKNNLVARGHRVWFDKDKLKEGQDWEPYIEEGLNWIAQDKANGRIVFLLTPHSTRRPDGYCLNEIAKAIMNNLSVIPIMVVFCEPPLSICRVQWLDMQDCIPFGKHEGIYENKFDRLIMALEVDKLDFEGVQNRLLNVLNPIEFSADVLKHMLEFTGRSWVFEAVDRWLNDTNASRVFWIIGAPGVGKSAISAWLRDNRREISAFHFCNSSSKEKSDPAKLVTSLAYQLSTQLPDYQARLARMNLEWVVSEYKDALTLFDILIIQPLSSISRPDRAVTILIDALDEATRDGKNEIAAFISSEFNKTPEWVKIFITSRPDPEVMGPLQGLIPYVFDTSTSQNISDIRDYLKKKVNSYIKAEMDVSGIIEEILSKSEGIFLYAEMVSEELAEGNLSIERLNEFPKGLGGVYDNFFRRQFPDVSRYKEKVRPFLGVIAAAFEPLGEELLQAISGWNEEEFNDFILSLGSLFIRSGGKIRAYHGSLMDWLTDKDKAFHYYVSVKEGHKKLAEMTINWQTFGSPSCDYIHRYGLHHLALNERWDDFLRLIDIQEFEAGGSCFIREQLLSGEQGIETLSKLLNHSVQVGGHHIVGVLLREMEAAVSLGHLASVKSLLSLTRPLCNSKIETIGVDFLHAWILYMQGDLGGSIAQFDQIDILVAGEYRNKISFHHANAIRESGDYLSAMSKYKKLFDLQKDVRSGESILFAQQYADILYVKGLHRSALAILTDIEKEFAAKEYPREIGESLRIKGHIFRMNELLDEAEHFYGEALQLFDDIGNIFGRARIETNLSETFAINDPKLALLHGEKAITLNSVLSIPVEVGKARNAVGLAQLVSGERDHALDSFKAALDIQTGVGYRAGIGMVLSNMVIAYLIERDFKQAAKTFDNLLDIFDLLSVYPFLVYRSALLFSITQNHPRAKVVIDSYSDKIEWVDGKEAFDRRVLTIYGKLL